MDAETPGTAVTGPATFTWTRIIPHKEEGCSSGSAELLCRQTPHHGTAILQKPFLKVYKLNLKKAYSVITEENKDTKGGRKESF